MRTARHRRALKPAAPPIGPPRRLLRLLRLLRWAGVIIAGQAAGAACVACGLTGALTAAARWLLYCWR